MIRPICKRFLLTIAEQEFHDVIMTTFRRLMERRTAVDVSNVGVTSGVEQVFDGLDFPVTGGVKQHSPAVGVAHVQFIRRDVRGVRKRHRFVSFTRTFWGLLLSQHSKGHFANSLISSVDYPFI